MTARVEPNIKLNWQWAQKQLNQHVGQKVQVRSPMFSVIGKLQKPPDGGYAVYVNLGDDESAHVCFNAADVVNISPTQIPGMEIYIRLGVF